MAKNPKIVVCKNCNATIPNGALVCPSCGAKIKKPFYKKGWLYVLIVVVVIGIIRTIGSIGGGGEKFEWKDIELSNILPEPKSNIGIITSNSEEYLRIGIHKTSKDEYDDYLNECKNIGFTVESNKSANHYEAYNKEGYKLSLSYRDSEKELSIHLSAPMKMGTFQWPGGGVASLLPVPKSTIGTISKDSSENFFIYVGQTSKDDYNAYVDECLEKGFSIDYDKGDKYYRADNADGCHVSLCYQGNNVMTVEIKKPKESPPPTMLITDSQSVSENEDTYSSGNGDTSSASEPEATGGLLSLITDVVETPSASESETTDGLLSHIKDKIIDKLDSHSSSKLVDGMRPEFKEAMDSYEAFYDKYCDFMEKYAENPDDISLVGKYFSMISKADKASKKFNAWGNEDLNDAEMAYFLDVSIRVGQKILELGIE